MQDIKEKSDRQSSERTVFYADPRKCLDAFIVTDFCLRPAAMCAIFKIEKGKP